MSEVEVEIEQRFYVGISKGIITLEVHHVRICMNYNQTQDLISELQKLSDKIKPNPFGPGVKQNVYPKFTKQSKENPGSKARYKLIEKEAESNAHKPKQTPMIFKK